MVVMFRWQFSAGCRYYVALFGVSVQLAVIMSLSLSQVTSMNTSPHRYMTGTAMEPSKSPLQTPSTQQCTASMVPLTPNHRTVHGQRSQVATSMGTQRSARGTQWTPSSSQMADLGARLYPGGVPFRGTAAASAGRATPPRQT